MVQTPKALEEFHDEKERTSLRRAGELSDLIGLVEALWTKKLPRDELLADFVQSSTPALVMWLQLREQLVRGGVKAQG